MNRLYDKERYEPLGNSPMQSFRLPPKDAEWVTIYCDTNKIGRAELYRKMLRFYREKIGDQELA